LYDFIILQGFKGVFAFNVLKINIWQIKIFRLFWCRKSEDGF